MVQSQELISFCAIFIALIQLSESGSFFRVTEDEAVQLEFPYPCDSNKVTIQVANRAPFYNSQEPAYLSLPVYQLHRFSVTNENCSVQVEINPVNRNDEATYICQAYRDDVILSRFTRKRLNVNYPPGGVVCKFSINYDVVGDWFPLQCAAPVGSLAGGIYCYQDYKRLPPWSKLVDTGETLKQTIWASKENTVFCCSVILNRPKDMCECKDFAWDPMGDDSQTNTIIDPCPATTPGPVATLPQYPERKVEDIYQLPQVIESLNLTDTNKDTCKSTADNTTILWGGVTAIGIIVVILMRLYVVERTNKQLQKNQSVNIHQEKTKIKEWSSTSSQEKELLLNVSSINEHYKARPKTWSFFTK